MNRSIFAASLLSMTAFIAAPQAMADNIADCEIVLTEVIEDDSGNGSVQVASYRPAADFIASVYNEDIESISEIDGLAVRALLCRRQNVIISDRDFKLLATGIPFVLSQNFDNAHSDLLTYFFKDGQFQYTHKGESLSEQRLAELTARFEDFNGRADVVEALSAKRAATAAELKIEELEAEELDEVELDEVEFEPEELEAAALDEAVLDNTTVEDLQVDDTPPEDTSPENTSEAYIDRSIEIDFLQADPELPSSPDTPVTPDKSEDDNN